MEQIYSYDVLLDGWSLYCDYLKMYIEMIGKPTSEYIKINDPISIQAKKDAMIKHDISEDIEAYDEYNKSIERQGVYMQYMSDVTDKVKKQLSEEENIEEENIEEDKINKALHDYLFKHETEKFRRIMEYCNCQRDDF